MPASQTPKNRKSPSQQSTHHSKNDHVLDLRTIVAQRDARKKESKQMVEQSLLKQKKKSRTLFPVKQKKGKKEKTQKKERAIKKQREKKKKIIQPIIQKKEKGAIKRKSISKKFFEKESEEFSMRTVVISFVVCAFGLGLFLLPAFFGISISTAQKIEQQVTTYALFGFDRLQEAAMLTQAVKPQEARYAFLEAQESFTLATEEIDSIDFFIPLIEKFPWRGKEISSGWHLLHAGEQLSLAGEQITKAMEELYASDIQYIAKDENQGITRLLLIAHATIDPTREYIETASTHLAQVDSNAIPLEKRDQVIRAKEELPVIESQLAYGTQMIELALSLLGNDEERRYAVIFANNHELRAGMGFPGALAFIDIRNGVVTNIDIPAGGIYDISGQLTKNVISPKPLHLVNPQWTLQDSLWFPHFPASAQKFQWFLENSAAPSVDGVIALTPSVIEDLLVITGPIDLQEKYGLTIDEKNFYTQVQLLAEEKYDVTQESKKIIADMTPLLFNQLFVSVENPEKMLDIMNVFDTALKEKQLVLYMNDPILQQSVSDLGWGGEIKTTEKDYLSVVQDNIAGGKTNSVVEDTIRHRVDIADDGSIVNTVTVTVNHTGAPTDLLKGVAYTGFFRFYVPEGSEILSASGFSTPQASLFLTPPEEAEIDEDLARISGDMLVNELTQVYSNTEFGKSVFGGWVQAEPGEGASVSITYKLPFQIDLSDGVDDYSLLVQKQLGSFGAVFSSEIVLPENMKITRSYPQGFAGISEILLEQDYFSGIIIEKKSDS